MYRTRDQNHADEFTSNAAACPCSKACTDAYHAFKAFRFQPAQNEINVLIDVVDVLVAERDRRKLRRPPDFLQARLETFAEPDGSLHTKAGLDLGPGPTGK